MRAIDADRLQKQFDEKSTNPYYRVNMHNIKSIINNAPTVEAIPKAEVKKFLEEGTKDVSNKVLAIVREDYIHKSVYEARLKADMVAMLEDLKKEMNPIKECEYQIYGKEHWNFVGKCQDTIQQKINALKEEIEG